MRYYRRCGQMDLTDRIAIETGLCKGESFKKIARRIGRHPSTVAHEVLENRTHISLMCWKCRWRSFSTLEIEFCAIISEKLIIVSAGYTPVPPTQDGSVQSIRGAVFFFVTKKIPQALDLWLIFGGSAGQLPDRRRVWKGCWSLLFCMVIRGLQPGGQIKIWTVCESYALYLPLRDEEQRRGHSIRGSRPNESEGILTILWSCTHSFNDIASENIIHKSRLSFLCSL